MDKIPTADEFARKYKDDQGQYKSLAEYFREFAGFHVKAAIEAIVKNNPGQMNEADIPYLQAAYPLENIK